jgi:hypothetical protein
MLMQPREMLYPNSVTGHVIYFSFWGVLNPVALTISKLLVEPSFTTVQGVYYTYILPLHVSAFAGHLHGGIYNILGIFYLWVGFLTF